MLKVIGYIIKFIFVSVIVLVLGQVLEYKGRSFSDHVKSALNVAEKGELMGTVKKTAGDIISSANSSRGTDRGNTGTAKARDEDRAPANADDAKSIVSRVKEIKDQEKAALNELLKN